jgi:hypothetical protein
MEINKNTYEYNQYELLECFRKAGVIIINVEKYFNNTNVKRNFGIESIKTSLFFPTSGNVIFILNDPQKFFSKIIKYGLL